MMLKKTVIAFVFLILVIGIISSCTSSGGKDNTPKIDYSKLNCSAVGNFHEGVQWVTRREKTYNADTKLYGLIDEKGEFLIEMTSEYTDVQMFYNDVAWVDTGKKQYRAIDKYGNYLTGAYRDVTYFSDNVAWVKNQSGNWMVIDKNDNEIFTYTEYEGVKEFSSFSEGKCLVALSLNHYGKKAVYVLDKKGELVPLENSGWYDWVEDELGSFVNGYARCGHKWGEVNGNVFCTLVYVKTDGSVLALKTGSGGGLLSQRNYSAPAFENIEIYGAGNFKDGKANIIFEGKDELYYKIQIDENGNFIDEPKNGLSEAAMGKAIISMKSPENSNFTLADIVNSTSGDGFIQ